MVEAALVAESAGVRLRIDGQGSVITCHVETNASGLMRGLPRCRSALRGVRTLIPFLIRAGLRLDVRACGGHIACAGSGVRQDLFARLLRVPGARLGR